MPMHFKSISWLRNAAKIALPVAAVASIFLAHLYAGAYSDPASIILAGFMSLLALLSLGILRPPNSYFSSPIIFLLASLGAIPSLIAVYQLLHPGFDREYAFHGLLRLTALNLTFIVGLTIASDDLSMKVMRRSFVSGLLLFSSVTLILYIAQLLGWLDPNPDLETDRLFRPLMSPNSTALALAIACCIGLPVLLSEGHISTQRGDDRLRTNFWRGIALVGIVISALDITLTRSRACIALCVIVAVAVWAASRLRTAKRWLILGTPALVGGGLLFWLIVFSRIGGVAGAAALRAQIIAAHRQWLFDRPVAGHGFGSFVSLNRRAISYGNFNALFNISAMHNVYLQWFEQAGLIASVAFGICFVLIFIYLLAGNSTGRRGSKYWIIGAVCAFAISLGQGLVDIGFEHFSIVANLALVLGTAFGILRRRQLRALMTEHALGQKGDLNDRPLEC